MQTHSLQGFYSVTRVFSRVLTGELTGVLTKELLTGVLTGGWPNPVVSWVARSAHAVDDQTSTTRRLWSTAVYGGRAANMTGVAIYVSHSMWHLPALLSELTAISVQVDDERWSPWRPTDTKIDPRPYFSTATEFQSKNLKNYRFYKKKGYLSNFEIFFRSN